MAKILKPKTITLEELLTENQELKEMVRDLYAACISYGLSPSYILSHPENNGKHDKIVKYLKDETDKPKSKKKNSKGA